MNLRELFSKYPLGCESFSGEWLRRWEALGRLLEMPAALWIRYKQRKTWLYAGSGTVQEELVYATHNAKLAMVHVRIILLDGTIIREWPTNA